MKNKAKRPILSRMDESVVDRIADSPPNTKSSEELELLKRVIEESRVFRRPASGKGQQSAKVKRKGVADAANGAPQRRRGTV